MELPLSEATTLALDRMGLLIETPMSVPDPAAIGVPDLDLPRPRGLFHLRAELARCDYDDQGTPTHDHAGTLRDQDAPAFGEQLRELL